MCALRIATVPANEEKKEKNCGCNKFAVYYTNGPATASTTISIRMCSVHRFDEADGSNRGIEERSMI